MKNRLKISGLIIALMAIAGVMLLGNVQSAQAFSLRLTGPVSSILINDGDASDLSATVGQIVAIGTLDGFDYTTQSSKTYPKLGTSSFPRINLTSQVDNTGAGSGTFIVEVSQIGFDGIAPGVAGFDTTATASDNPGTSTVKSWLDLGNGLFTQTTLLASFGPASGTFKDTISTAVAIGAGDVPYSLSLFQKYELGAAQTASFTTDVIANPEPGTVALLGFGLVGMVGAGVRRKMKKKEMGS